MNKKTKKNSKLYKALKNLLYIAAVIYVGQTLISQQITMQQTRIKIAEQQDIIEKQQIIRDNLAVKLQNINKPEYMEKLAREKLGMIKTDEILFIDITTKR